MYSYILFSGHNSGSNSISGSQGGGLSVLSTSRLRTITNLTRKLSLSNSRILNENPSRIRIQPPNIIPQHHHTSFKSSRSINGIGKSEKSSYISF